MSDGKPRMVLEKTIGAALIRYKGNMQEVAEKLHIPLPLVQEVKDRRDTKREIYWTIIDDESYQVGSRIKK